MRIESDALLASPLPAVIAWHERPGALVRLTPPGLASIQEPARSTTPTEDAATPTATGSGLEVGRRVSIELGPPLLPRRPHWVLRHASLSRQGSREAPEALAFEDRQVTGPFRLWHHRHELRGEGPEATRLVDRIDVEAPRGICESIVHDQIQRTLAFRTRQLSDDLSFWQSHPTPRPLTVAIAGASGLIGTQLAALLATGGHRVLRMVRGRAAGPGGISYDPRRGVLDPADLEGVDAVVNLAGRSIATRLTARAKQEILSSRVSTSQLIARTLAGMDDGPRVLVQASAIGIYGAQRPGEVLTEESSTGDDVLAQVCTAWQEAARPAAEAGIRTVHLRTGIVLSDGGGALVPQLPLYLLGLGGRLTRGDAVTSWITLDDMVRAYAHAIIADALDGPVNAVGPAPVDQVEFARTLGTVLNRPSALPVPGFGPALLLGREGARELVQADQDVSDVKLLASGFAPAQRTAEQALRHVLRR